ncbi:MAG: hypothetical protein AAF739_08775 [Pseudomonadota bacterium]
MPVQLPNYFVDNLWYISLVASFVTFPLAWVADAVFKHRAFGVIGNYILLMIGSLSGIALFMYYSGGASRSISEPELAFFSAAAGASMIIVTAGVVKRFFGS